MIHVSLGFKISIKMKVKKSKLVLKCDHFQPMAGTNEQIKS